MEEAFENERVFEFIPNSTEPPEILQNSATVGLVVIIVIVAVLLISLLFCIAIFMDCRHQKLLRLQQMDRVRKINKLKLPSVNGSTTTSTRDSDKDSIVDKMHIEELTDPPV